MANFGNLLLIFLLSFILIKATDILILNFKALSQKTHLRKFALTGLVLGLATSLPEFFVGLTAAFEGRSILSLGNIMGANMANLSLVVGGAALIGGVIKVHGSFLRRDIFYAFLAAASPLLLLSDKSLSRVDGLILLALYVFYQVAVFTEKTDGSEKREDYQARRLLRSFKISDKGALRKEIGWIFLGIALMLFAADALVKIAVKLAIVFNLPLLLIGLLIVSVGTTLPELIFEIEALKERQSSMVFGNLLGSIVANGTLIIGLVALISPFTLQNLDSYLISTMAFLLIFILFYFFVRTKRCLERWEGGFLLLVFFLFVFLEFRLF
ncbi:sodium:calcium antiporter [Candidatus Shapirobacteria bacterium]|nr:sodium:calcium antiporter [Candidatus Shapirobacteria bacterium]